MEMNRTGSSTGWGSLNHRERAILLAVAEGRAQMLVGLGCDLAVDGSWCDHQTVRGLLAAGLIRQVGIGRFGHLLGVELTTTGRQVVCATTAATAHEVVASDDLSTV
jgi:hypothetical protein